MLSSSLLVESQYQWISPPPAFEWNKRSHQRTPFFMHLQLKLFVKGGITDKTLPSYYHRLFSTSAPCKTYHRIIPISQISEINLFVKGRVTFRPLVDHFPCFSAFQLSLVETPHLDFAGKLGGSDILAIPLVQPTVERMLQVRRSFSFKVWFASSEAYSFPPHFITGVGQ